MCFYKRKFKKTIYKKKLKVPINVLNGCRMIVLIDEPSSKFYKPEYCNCKVVEDGLCEIHKEINYFHK